jgi:sigma-E factor negative regulatory protein RseB
MSGARAAACVVGLALLTALPVRAMAERLEPAQALQWLQRMHVAATQHNYQGTLVVSSGASMASSRVAHFGEGRQSYERVEVLDGHPKRVLRHNDKVLTLWPASRVASFEQRDAIAPFPALPAADEAGLLERYEMVAQGTGRVAGHEAVVLLMRPRDGWRFAQRLWAEPGSGLLLRSDVLGADGRVLESSAFSDLKLGAGSKPESVQAALKQLDGWRVLKPQIQQTALEAEGWQLKSPVAGFRQAGCVKRQLDPADEARVPGGVIQTTFTDGMTHVSLFIEPFQGERHRAGSMVAGATHTWMQPLGAFWLTVVGEVPMATLKQFAAALERQR